MLAILKCIGVYNGQEAEATAAEVPHSPWYGRMHKDAEELRREEEAAAAREAAKAALNTQLRKESRRGIGLLSVRHVYISDDSTALIYTKPGAKAAEKSLPFATMEAPVVDGVTVSVTMRDQPKATSTYKFSAANERAAREWADALALFVRAPAPSKAQSAAAEPVAEAIASAA